MKKYNNRNEVEDKYKWDLSDFYRNDEEFNQDYDKCVNIINHLKDYKGCTKDAKSLEEFIKLQVDAITIWENLYVYSYLVNDQELGISDNIARKNKASKLEGDLINALSFFEPELLKLSKEEYEKLFITNSNLLQYKADLDKTYRNKEHILKEDEEIIVSSLITSMNNFSDMSSNMLSMEHNYGKVKIGKENITISTNNYRNLTKNENVAIRKKVYNSFYKVIDQYSNSQASFLNSYVSMKNTLAHIYKYKSSWDSKLFSLNMPNEAYVKLRETVENNLSSLQRYYKLKCKVLKLDKLHMYDMNLELAKSKDKYSIEESLELIKDSLKPLGNEYHKCFLKIIDNHLIDYCQYKGKCSGAYSFATLDKDSRILMSFNEDLDSVSTIAHEGGHNVHHQLVKANNIAVYRDISSLVCEVASLTNECLLSSYLAKNGKTKEEKLAGIANILGVINSNLFGAVREGHMEEEMYEYVRLNNSLTKDYLDNLTIKYLKKYYQDSVVLDKYSKDMWVTRSHYYMNFYLYSYAICISVASYVASKILNNDEDMLNKYMKFLKTGSDVWPIDAFKILGIDLTKEDVYKTAIDYYNKMIDEFEKIYNS